MKCGVVELSPTYELVLHCNKAPRWLDRMVSSFKEKLSPWWSRVYLRAVCLVRAILMDRKDVYGVVVDGDVVDDDGRLELLMERSKRGGRVGSYLRRGSR